MAKSTKTSNLYSIRLQPGVNAFGNPGRYWRLIESPVPVLVKLGDLPAITLSPGQCVPFDAPDQFDRYEITNPLSTVLRIRFWSGYVDFRDDKIDQIEAATVFDPVDDVAGVYEAGVLAAGAALNLAGTVDAGRLRRKAVQVFNLDPASNLELRNAADRVGGIVRPGETITQPVSGFIRIKNPTGAAIACYVSEIWWTP